MKPIVILLFLSLAMGSIVSTDVRAKVKDPDKIDVEKKDKNRDKDKDGDKNEKESRVKDRPEDDPPNPYHEDLINAYVDLCLERFKVNRGAADNLPSELFQCNCAIDEISVKLSEGDYKRVKKNPKAKKLAKEREKMEEALMEAAEDCVLEDDFENPI